jgi:hypothetical protein
MIPVYMIPERIFIMDGKMDMIEKEKKKGVRK